MFGPSGKLYQPPSFRLRLLERRQEEAELPPDEARELAEAMARVNDEKRQPKQRGRQTAV